MVSHHEKIHGPSQDPIPICVIEYGWWKYAWILRYMVSHHEITHGPDQDPIPICVIEYGWCFDKILHGRSSWKNTWPKPRPNTNMHDWVWVMEVCFDLTVHGQSSWKNIWPNPRPNTNDGTWSWSSLEQHMTQAKTQYQYVEFNMDDSDWLEMMVHGHHWNNIWPKSRPNTNICICRLIW